ncbi:MAG: leucine-rich repeat protein, partial [Saccharofermentanales bacterium]
MKKSLSILIATLIVFQTLLSANLSVAAETSGDYIYTIVDGNAEITDYSGSDSSLTIPDTLGGYPVTSITGQAFYGSYSLTSVTIPDSVSFIGNMAFAYCYNLTQILISANNPSYKSIAGVLFNKSGTQLILYPGGKEGAYTIPDGVTSILSNAFYCCYGLTSVSIPSGVTIIGDLTFYMCFNLTAVNIPGSVISIGRSAFYGCSELVGLTIAEGVKTLGESVFSGCDSLTSVSIPASVESIDIYAFSYCKSLVQINVSAGNSQYKSIDGVLFNKQGSLLIQYPSGKPGDYVIPGSVINIGNYASFTNCTNLTSLSIPDSVLSFGTYEFYGCSNLTQFIVSSGNPVFMSIDGVIFNKLGNEIIRYPAGKAGDYTIPGNVTDIGVYAFYGCEKLTEAIIPDSAANIGYGAFDGCTGLTSIVIPDSITYIDYFTFQRCIMLSKVSLPGNLTGIGSYAFSYCESLQSITMPESVENIDSHAFYGCSELSNVLFLGNAPNGFGDSVFYNCATDLILYHSVASEGWSNPWNWYNTAAVSSAAQYSVTYYPNGATGGSVPQSGNLYSFGTAATISYNTGNLEKTNAEFVGWNTEPDGSGIAYAEGEGIVIGIADILLYAIWNYSYVLESEHPYMDNLDKTWVYSSPDPAAEALAVSFDPFTIVENSYDWIYLYDASAAEIDGSPFTGDQLRNKTVIIPGNSFSIRLTSDYYGADYGFGIVSVAAIESPGDYEVMLDNGQIEIIGYTGIGGNIEIPSTICGYPVKGIGDWAFAENGSITGVSLPDGLTYIGNGAFYACSNLADATISDDVSTIGEMAFYACSSLAGVEIPAGVTSIGYSAFAGCTGLLSINVPYSVTLLYDGVFAGCTSLTQILVDPGNPNYKSIDGVLFNKTGSDLLQYPGGKPGNYTIPELVTFIRERAFYGCNLLKSIAIPSTVIEWGGAFRNSGLTSVTFGSGTTSIPAFAFTGCSGLQNVAIPYGVTDIGENSFQDCTGLQTVSLPDTLTDIWYEAFAGCSALTGIVLPDGLAYIGYYAFSDCNSLKDISIPSSVIYMSGAFYGAGLTSATIEAGTAIIQESAFFGCSSLETISIPASVTEISGYAFFNCYSLADMTLPSSLKVIGEMAFYENGALRTINIPDSVTDVGYGAFFGCSSVDSLSIGSKVTTLGNYAFSGCSSLSNVSIPGSVMNWGGAFRSSGVTDVIIGNGITSIPAYAFEDCTKLQSITIPSGVTDIIESAFFNCTGLSEITLPDTLTDIWYNAFENCTSLTGITLPASVEYIDGFAFYGCSSLVSATFLGDAPESLGDMVFNNCAPGFKIKYYSGALGWSNPWNGYATEQIATTKTVTYLNWNSSTYQTQTVNNGETVNAPVYPIRTGYTFNGWYTAATGGTKISFPYKVDLDITLYAQYTILSYPVTFNSQSGSAVASKTASYNTAITAPAAPTRTGYTFGGWYKESGCINAWNFATDKITAATTLYAKWTIITYTVTFNSMSGSAVTSKTASYNTSAAAPTNPTRSGYTFLGWYTSSAYTTQWIFTTNKVTANTTLYARWLASAATGLKTVSAGYNSILLTWTAVSGANNYEIYRSTASAGTYALVTTITASAAPSYTNISLSTGTNYYYKVRAYALVGTSKVYSGYSAIVYTKAVPATPTALKAVSASYNSIRLTWTAVSGASGYSIYRATSSAGTYTLVTTIAAATTPTYTNTSLPTGTTYYYKVSAYRLVGTTKVYGSQAAAVSAKAVPATPTAL